MFFFLSLAIVFLFILLLCYYLKNKIDVVERRVSSQTDVLGKLIREFKLQACFGNSGGNGGEGNTIHGIQGSRLEPVLEEENDESESDDETDYEEGADTDEDTDVGMEKVKDDDLLDIDETVKDIKKEEEEDEYKDLDFEKVANEDLPVVHTEMEDFTGEDFDETVCVTAEDKAKYDDILTEKKEDKETFEKEQQDVLEEEHKAEPKNDLDTNEEHTKEPEFDDEENTYRHSAKQAKEAKIEDYKKMSLVQLKHVAQHTFNLSTTQIAKMKKDDLLKWILDQ